MTLEELNLYTRELSKPTNDKALRVFYSDKFPEKIYKRKHPNLDDGEINYIRDNYSNPVKKIIGDAIFETQKIFTDGNFSIKCENEKLNEYISEYGIIDFFKNIYWQNILLDSDCILTYHIKYSEFIEKQSAIELQNEYLPIHPYLVTPENVILKTKDKIVYKVNGENNHNFVIIFYNENGGLTYAHYSFNILDKNITPILFWEFEINEGKKYYRKGDGIKIVDNNELTIQSYFSPSIPLLSSIIFDSINLSITQMRTTFPIPVVVGEPCSSGCLNGILTEVKDGKSCEIECSKCKGTGYDQPFSPFNTMYVTRGNNALDTSTPPAPHLYWSEPPQSAVNGLRDQIQNNMNKVFDYLGMNYSNTEVKGSETALGKMIDREQIFSTFKNYSQNIGMTIEWWLQGWGELMFPLESDKEVKVDTNNNFRTFSTAEINAIFTELRNANAPLYQLREMLKERYVAVNEMGKYNIVDKYFLYYSDELLLKKGTLGYYDKIKIVISENIMKWVDEVIDMPEDKIDNYLNSKAKELMTLPESGLSLIA